jgi:glycosyltransferase involved in cell wall biosynthesis
MRLDIVGPNDDVQYLNTVRSYLRDYQLEASVTIHGLVDDDQLRQRYENADIMLLTSLEESSPICVVEAMASGLPIVSTDVGGIAEMVTENAILCRSGDTNSVVHALIQILRDDARARDMGRRGQELARSKWSDEAVARATYEAYREIVRAG